jgi:hypothetical protein
MISPREKKPTLDVWTYILGVLRTACGHLENASMSQRPDCEEEYCSEDGPVHGCHKTPNPCTWPLRILNHAQQELKATFLIVWAGGILLGCRIRAPYPAVAEPWAMCCSTLVYTLTWKTPVSSSRRIVRPRLERLHETHRDMPALHVMLWTVRSASLACDFALAVFKTSNMKS